MTQGVFVPEALAGKRLTDDSYRRQIIYVVVIEIPSLQERNAHGWEIAWPAQAKARVRQAAKVAGEGLFTFDGIRTAGIILSCWQSHHGSRRYHAGHAPQSGEEIVQCLACPKVVVDARLFKY